MSFGADGKLPTNDEVAKANHDLSTLVKAAMAAGAMELLDKPGNLTVFAPNNAAFAKLPKGTLEFVIQHKYVLLRILKRHVLPTQVLSKDLKEGTNTFVNLRGNKLEVVKKGEVLTSLQAWDGLSGFELSKVIKADIMASNGVVHVIDTLL